MSSLSQLTTPSRDAAARRARRRSCSLIVCAGVVLASLDLFIVNVALPADRPRLPPARRWPRRPLVGAERLRDRVRGASWCCSGGSPSATGASTASCSAWRSSWPPRRRAAPRPACRCWSRSGSCRPPGAALLTPTSLGLILATFPPERRHGAVRTWTAVGGLAAAARPGHRRAAGRGELALGVPRQRARSGCSRSSSAGAGCPRVPGHPVPAPDALGGAADHRRRGRAVARPGQGRHAGAGATPGRSPRSAVGRGRAGAVRGCTALRQSQPADRPGAVPAAAVHGRLGRGAAVLGRVRRDAALARAVGAGRLALVGAAARAWRSRPGR